jgi:hypothetical protein
VCTGFGVSDKLYTGTLEKLLYGIGQGSCSSPILWALLNQLLITALGEEVYCIHLISINGLSDTTRPGDSFVDDTTTGATTDDCTAETTDKDVKELTDEEEKCVARMEDIIHFFLDLLQVTGGYLAPGKCVWYLISHRWKNGIPSLLPVHQSHRGIKMTSRSTGFTSAIKRKATDQGHRTLGFYLTGDGNSSAHKEIMLDK